MAETQFVMDGWMDEWCELNMSAKVPLAHKKAFELYR